MKTECENLPYTDKLRSGQDRAVAAGPGRRKRQGRVAGTIHGVYGMREDNWQVTESAGFLYLGSFEAHRIVRVKL